MLSVPKESFPASDTLISLPSVCLLSIGMAALQGYNYNDIKSYETLTKYNSLYMCVCVCYTITQNTNDFVTCACLLGLGSVGILDDISLSL